MLVFVLVNTSKFDVLIAHFDAAKQRLKKNNFLRAAFKCSNVLKFSFFAGKKIFLLSWLRFLLSPHLYPSRLFFFAFESCLCLSFFFLCSNVWFFNCCLLVLWLMQASRSVLRKPSPLQSERRHDVIRRRSQLASDLIRRVSLIFKHVFPPFGKTWLVSVSRRLLLLCCCMFRLIDPRDRQRHWCIACVLYVRVSRMQVQKSTILCLLCAPRSRQLASMAPAESSMRETSVLLQTKTVVDWFSDVSVVVCWYLDSCACCAEHGNPWDETFTVWRIIIIDLERETWDNSADVFQVGLAAFSVDFWLMPRKLARGYGCVVYGILNQSGSINFFLVGLFSLISKVVFFPVGGIDWFRYGLILMHTFPIPMGGWVLLISVHVMPEVVMPGCQLWFWSICLQIAANIYASDGLVGELEGSWNTDGWRRRVRQLRSGDCGFSVHAYSSA